MRLRVLWFCVALVAGVCLYHPLETLAITENAQGGLAQFRDQRFEVNPAVAQYTALQAGSTALPGVADFASRHAGSWETGWDERGNRPNLVQGSGIALIPGRGNGLKAADVGLATGQAVTISVVEARLRQFIAAHPDLFRVAQTDLQLQRDSGQSGPNGRLWVAEFEVFHQGVPVRGARVFFRINSGNIIQFGTELVGDVRVSAQPAVSGPQAVALALRRAGVEPATAKVLEAGTLKLYPELGASEAPGERYSGAAGQGYAHRLVREVDFRRAGDNRTYRAVVDAQSGAVLELYDTNQYVTATVTGGVYPNTNTDPETTVPLANLTVTNQGQKVTDENGQYDYTGGTASAGLLGPFVAMRDQCAPDLPGKISNATTGNLNFGTSGGTDCTNPTTATRGNTHASRTSFFQLNRIKDVAASFLPSNAWLPTQLNAKTNISQQCNAFWDGANVNFFKSGGGCSNTGELAGVIIHEFGHGLDQNTGGAASEGGSGEAVGDITAFLETRDSCMGHNFRPGVPCHNCASTGCTGVRDMTPFSVGGAATVARPSNVASATGIDCGRSACGAAQACKGPMGYECHCESYIASTAVWDLQDLLVAQFGTNGGFAAMQQIWYDSLTPSKSAYQVTAGGQCNPAATVNGCGASNWYTVFLAVDDDDGNLANGTPNGCRIWQALNDHGIACGAQPACSP